MHRFLTILRHISLGLWWLVRNLVLAPLGWVVQELFGQAKTGTKKILRPFLWPVVGIGMVAMLYDTMDSRAFGALLQSLLTLGVMCVGIWLMFRAVFPKKKKKKS